MASVTTSVPHLATSAARLDRMSGALLSGSYRYDTGEWETADNAGDTVADRAPLAPGGIEARPYFETLFVSPAPAANSIKISQEIRRLRRPEDTHTAAPAIQLPPKGHQASGGNGT